MDLLEFEDIKEIFLQFKSLHKNIQELTSKKSNREGLSADQCYLLGLIDHFDHPNQKILAERLNITPATLSVRLQRLEKAGFIEKVEPVASTCSRMSSFRVATSYLCSTGSRLTVSLFTRW